MRFSFSLIYDPMETKISKRCTFHTLLSNYLKPLLFLVLLVFTQESYCHGARVRRPSVRTSSVNSSGFSETTAWIHTKLYGKLAIHHLRAMFSFFQNFKFSNFNNLVFVFVNMGLYGCQHCRRPHLPQITPEFFQTSLEFLSPISSQSYFSDFGNFDMLNFNAFLLFP